MANDQNRIKIRVTPAPAPLKIATSGDPRAIQISHMANVYYLAKDWAIKMGEKVEQEDYSSKQWAAWSKVWAEGTDAQVEALGGTHSAKGWAEKAVIDVDAKVAAHDADEEAHPYIQDRIDDLYATKQDNLTPFGTINLSTDNVISTKTFIFEQGIASDSWEVVHSLNKRPSVTVVDSAGTVLTCEIQYIDDNNCVLRFNAPFVGKAYFN